MTAVAAVAGGASGFVAGRATNDAGAGAVTAIPTAMTSTGGIDVAATTAQSVLVTHAGSANIVFIIAALLLIPAVIVSDRLAARRTAQEVVTPG